MYILIFLKSFCEIERLGITELSTDRVWRGKSMCLATKGRLQGLAVKLLILHFR